MKKHTFTLSETRYYVRNITVEADSLEKAKDKMWNIEMEFPDSGWECYDCEPAEILCCEEEEIDE